MLNISHTTSLPADFVGHSRVWIYQADRPFTPQEARQIETMLQAFTRDWKSHGTPVRADGYLFYGQFIVLMADETAAGVSGCSTDSSVHLIKQIEQHTGAHLFDRLNLAFYIGDKVQLVPLAHLPKQLENGLIHADTLYFNNTIQTKEELEASWLIPLKDSWLGKKYLRVQTAP
jgi:hypothetical protein